MTTYLELARAAEEALTAPARVPYDIDDQDDQRATLDLEHQPWGIATARALAGALWRRVAAASNATPPARRPVGMPTMLAPHAETLYAAIRARDLPEVRRAIYQYERAAAPIVAAYRASRMLVEART